MWNSDANRQMVNLIFGGWIAHLKCNYNCILQITRGAINARIPACGTGNHCSTYPMQIHPFLHPPILIPHHHVNSASKRLDHSSTPASRAQRRAGLHTRRSHSSERSAGQAVARRCTSPSASLQSIRQQWRHGCVGVG